MLEHLERQHEVERAVIERQRVEIALVDLELRMAGAELLDRLVTGLEPVDLGAGQLLGQPAGQEAFAAADVEDPLRSKRRQLAEQTAAIAREQPRLDAAVPIPLRDVVGLLIRNGHAATAA